MAYGCGHFSLSAPCPAAKHTSHTHLPFSPLQLTLSPLFSPAQVKQLHDNANYVRRRLIEMGLHVLGDWDSPVMPIMIYHSGACAGCARWL
jgi:hypothetical protein